MYGTIKELREALQRMIESVDSETQRKSGYDNPESGAGVEYGDLHEIEDVSEDTDRVRRHHDGYGDDLEESNLYSDSDSCKKKAKSHAAPLSSPEDVGGGPPGSFVADEFDPVSNQYLSKHPEASLSMVSLFEPNSLEADEEEMEEDVLPGWESLKKK